MQRRRKGFSRILTLLIFAELFQSASIASAEDRDFSRLVKEIEFRFHAKRTHVPLFGRGGSVLL
jgi:hypothetical protein